MDLKLLALMENFYGYPKENALNMRLEREPQLLKS